MQNACRLSCWTSWSTSTSARQRHDKGLYWTLRNRCLLYRVTQWYFQISAISFSTSLASILSHKLRQWLTKGVMRHMSCIAPSLDRCTSKWHLPVYDVTYPNAVWSGSFRDPGLVIGPSMHNEWISFSGPTEILKCWSPAGIVIRLQKVCIQAFYGNTSSIRLWTYNGRLRWTSHVPRCLIIPAGI